jgi:subtilisin family serine protease
MNPVNHHPPNVLTGMCGGALVSAVRVYAKRLLGVALLAGASQGIAAGELAKYRVMLTDKAGTAEAALRRPDRLLSARALDRRIRHQVPTDSTDVPVAAAYLDALRDAGFRPVVTSRWMNSVVVESDADDALERLRALPFVSEAKQVWRDGGTADSFFVEQNELESPKERRAASTTPSRLQLTALGGDKLHEAGFRGEGMQIAVIDAGFLNVDKIESLASRVLGVRDFVAPDGDIYATHPHGTNVLSVMAAPATADFSGTAPEASYWLLRSEESTTEFPVEEDYWVAAAEYADSLGVDLINSSLGYFDFDDASMNYTHADLNGRTAFITRGATMASDKGIFVVVSAGNEGGNTWQRISFPADCREALTVGAVDADLAPAYFTGVGQADESGVKPDVAGVGSPAYVYNTSGALQTQLGTSFATPAVAGLAACLWQAMPRLTNKELGSLIRRFGSQAATPDAYIGYGVPNFYEAYRQTTPLPQTTSRDTRFVCLDSLARTWMLLSDKTSPLKGSFALYSLTGVEAMRRPIESGEALSLATLPSGCYIATFQSPAFNFSQRIYLTVP